jgi:hypothetical protein
MVDNKNKASDPNLAIKNTIVDTRPWDEKFGDIVDNGEGVLFTGFILAGLIIFAPSFAEILFVAGILFMLWAKRRKYFLPFRMPVSFGGLDENDVNPQGNFHKARGIFYFGNEVKSKKELWFAADDVKTHMVIFGTTGAGKALRDREFVLTEHSWKRNEDLEEGDYVQTPNGELSKILKIYPQGDMDLAELKFSDGRVIKTTWDHLWTFYDANKVNKASDFIGANDTIYLKTQTIKSQMKKGVSLALPYSLPKGSLDDYYNQHEFLEWWEKSYNSPSASYLPLLRLSLIPLNARVSVWKQMMDSILLKSDIAKHFGDSTSLLLPQNMANGLVFLARSLGLWAAIENEDRTVVFDDHENLHEALEKVDFNDYFDYSDFEESKNEICRVSLKFNTPILLTSLKDAKEKDACRCIQIEDPSGLFITRQHIVTHNTETLVSITYNALVQGSGFVYVDGKGDNGLWGKVMGCARQTGRDGEVLVVNYMTGGEESFGLPSSKNSNTLNPLVTGTSATLVELVSSLMDAAGSDPMWKSRAVALLQGIMPPLVFMRNKGEIILDVDIIRNYMNLPNIEKLASRDDLPPSTLEGVKSYLDSLPGYVWGEEKQEVDTMQQHGFLQMQFTRIFSMLADVYGFIFRTNLSEILFYDVVVNRRILIVLLPALEKDPEGLSQLGKIILACLRQMMATGLGSKLEGEHRTIIASKPTAGPAPFLAVLDEYGYYVTKGAAVMPAQARSLGVGMVFAGQDYAAFKKNDNASEAQSTVANCTTKLFMKIVESEDTYNLFKSLVGEATVAKKGGLEKEDGRLVAQKNISYQSVAKASLGDLSKQTEGFAHVIVKDILIRAKTFFCNPPELKEYRLNYFLRVEPIKPDDANKFVTNMKRLKTSLLDKQTSEHISSHIKIADAILAIYKSFEMGEIENKSPIESGIMALVGQSIVQSLQMGQSKANANQLRKRHGRMKDHYKGKASVFNQNEPTPWDKEELEEGARERFGGRFKSDHFNQDTDKETGQESSSDDSSSSSGSSGFNRPEGRSSRSSAMDNLPEEFKRRLKAKEKEREEANKASVPNKNKTIKALNEINEKIDPVSHEEKYEQEKQTENLVEHLDQLTNYPDQRANEKDVHEVLDIIQSLHDDITSTSENSRYT